MQIVTMIKSDRNEKNLLPKLCHRDEQQVSLERTRGAVSPHWSKYFVSNLPEKTGWEFGHNLHLSGSKGYSQIENVRNLILT